MDLVLPQTWAEASEMVIPVLRRATEPAHAWQAERADAANRLLRRPWAPLLNEMVVLDLPDLRMYLNRSHLDLWQVEAEQVFSAARSNLEPHAATGLSHRPEWGLWQLASGDGYEASRLLLPGWLAAFGQHLSGRPVCAVPANRVLLVGDEADGEQIATLADIAIRGFRSAGAPLSPVLYSVGETGRIVPWEPDAADPMWGELADAARLFGAHEYAEQTAQMLDDDTLGAQILSVSLVRSEQGSLTRTEWNRSHGPALLPATDLLVLIDGDSVVETSFSAFQEHAGGCLEATSFSPARWLARWPMPGTLADLK